MAETNEYVEKLKKYADAVGGTFHYSNQGTKSMVRVAWNRVEIEIPHLSTAIYFVAYSGNNSTDTYSGFFASTKLSSAISCKISRKDPLDKVFTIFRKKQIKTNQPGFDKMFSVSASNTAIVRQISGRKQIRKFLELNLNPPLQFEISNNEKGYIKSKSEKTNLVALKSNRWMVDQKQLNTLLDGFKIILEEVNGTPDF